MIQSPGRAQSSCKRISNSGSQGTFLVSLGSKVSRTSCIYLKLRHFFFFHVEERRLHLDLQQAKPVNLGLGKTDT